MTTLESVRNKAKTIIRNKLQKAAPENTPASKLDQLAQVIWSELDKNNKTIPDYQQALMVFGANCGLLGAKVLTTSAKKILSQECSENHGQQELEEDAEERKITNDFAASELCDTCGLPKSNDKMNINRLDVEDEVFGKQFDYVYNDICTCKYKEEAEKRKNESEADRQKRLDDAKKQRKQETEKSSVLSLWEEQNDLAEEEEKAREKQQEEREKKVREQNQPSSLSLPERRDRN